MKHNILLPIFLVLSWLSGLNSAPSYAVAFNNGSIEAYLTKACSPTDPSGKIDVEIKGGISPFDVVIKDATGVTVHWANVDETFGQGIQGDEDKSDLLPGSYIVQVTDLKCSVATMTVEIGVKEAITISATPAAICQEGNGSINPTITGGEGNLSFLWSNGATTQNISGLSAGTFTITVTDGGGCRAVKEIEVENGKPIIFPLNFKTINSICNLNNGEILPCSHGILTIKGEEPFIYSWSNGSSDCNIKNLQAGTYTLTVTGSDGCSGEKAQFVESIGEVNVILEEIQHECETFKFGEIHIEVDRPSFFKWSENTGYDRLDGFEHSTNLVNLTQGTYCVTITDKETSCTLEKCYNILSGDPVEIIDMQTIGTCAYSNNGKIILVHTTSVSPYLYNWKHIETGIENSAVGEYTFNANTQLIINNLYKGNYTITVTDNCGRVSTGSCKVDADDFNVDIDVEHGCKMTSLAYVFNAFKAYEGKISVNVSGVNSPYKIQLKSNSINYEKIVSIQGGNFTFDGLETSTYSLKVTDAKGCEYIKQIDIKTLIIGYKKEEIEMPCKNMNSGSIKYYIINPRSLNLSAYYLGIKVYESTKTEDEFTLDNLYSGAVNVEWKTDENCDFGNFSIILDEKPTGKIFSKFNTTTNMCVYDEMCDGEIIARDSYLETVTFDLDNASTFNCNIPKKCRDKEVGFVDGRLRLIRGGHYAFLVEALKNQFPNQLNNLEHDLARVYESGPCLWWYYCPQNLRIWAQAWFVDPACSIFSTGDWERDLTLNGTCLTLNCCGESSAVGCLENFIEGHEIPVNIDVKSISLCLPKTINIAQLIIYENELKSKYPNYNESTELYQFIHKSVLPDPYLRRKATCGEVRFCLRDFKLLSNNLSTINCGGATNYKIDPLYPFEFGLNEFGKIEAIDSPNNPEYYSTCSINAKGVAICDNGPEEIICPEQLPPPAPIIFCPRLFKDDDPIYARQLQCSDDLKDLVFDSLRNEFILFWTGKRNDSTIIIGEKRYSDLSQKIKNNFYYKMTADSFQYFHFNTDIEFAYFLKYDNINNLSWIKSNLKGEIQLTVPLGLFSVSSVLENKNGTFNITGIDNISGRFLVKNITKQGQIIFEKEIQLNSVILTDVFVFEDISVGYINETSQLIFFNANFEQRINVPSNIQLKDIKTTSSNKVVIAGDFKGQININGKIHDSKGYKNAIFLTYDQNGNLLASQSVQNNRDETVMGMATNGNDEVAYHGRYQEVVSYNIDSTQNVIDSCIFINIIKLDDQCPPFTSILTYGHRVCQLAWDAAPAGYTTQLQIQVNGIWIPAEKALGIDVTPTSPFAITRDGSYRLLHTKVGCPDIISNVVATTCTNGCVCPSPVLSYDPTTCVLTWSITECVGYTVSLQRLNASNVWETVVQQATSPYTVAVNGSYRLSLTKGLNTIGTTCAAVQSNTVVTACTPSTNACICTAPVLNHNTSTCQLSWTASSCAGYSTTLQRSVIGVWTTVNATSPYTLPTNTNGQYRLVTSKAGCSDLYSAVVNVTCTCTSPASITIYNYGASGLGQNATILKGQSYTHNTTQGSPDACDESYIQLAFASNVVNNTWSFYVNGTVAVMPGVIIGNQYIVDLYLPTPPSGGTADVFMQSPCGDFYQLHLVYDCESSCPIFTIVDQYWPNYAPCFHINIESNIETDINITYTYYFYGYDSLGNYFEFPEDQTIEYHVLDGINNFIFCGPEFIDNSRYHTITYQINCDGCNNCNLSGTMGMWLRPINKNPENIIDVDKNVDLRNQGKNQVRFYPNPFSKGINLEFASATNDHLDLVVYNYLGTKVFAKALDVIKGQNLRYIDEFENVPSGVYIIKIKAENDDYTTRVIKLE